MLQKNITNDTLLNEDFPRAQVNGFADNLDFEKIKAWDRLKSNTADPSHFLEDCASNCLLRLTRQRSSEQFTISPTLTKNRVFILQKSELEKRLDPFFYVPELLELEKKVLAKKPKKLRAYALSHYDCRIHTVMTPYLLTRFVF